jgi:3-methyladenine DNA glycosylase/8-oxoguanine DNA glycosylase
VRYSFDLTLLRNGSRDPTTRVQMTSAPGPTDAVIDRATITPLGPGAVQIRLTNGQSDVLGYWGPGGHWLAEHSRRLTATDHTLMPTEPLALRHPALQHAHRLIGTLLLPATDTPYHEILPAILSQRITAAQALSQWAALCIHYGEPAPGPLGLRLPPQPERLRAIPSWEFHRLGIERQRAATLHTAARYASFINGTRHMTGDEARRALVALPGIGVWTAAVTVGVSHGDPDALPIGDFHVKNTVAWALTGTPRGTDDDMLSTLSAYAGQRWRVVRMLEKTSGGAPRFGPKRRLVNISRL